ncbi:hypothetical protein [Amycolatopsis sp. DG1A-15b]|uniref:hypothetical protein n=1 Tax=Amycolatopsis sp. DG1A-15b TaxID=3052846 RepID=UPI00255B60F1|nr:hypothetical protein [Amycolatopsis sp. DG1A-15b]WIX91869.1 hypothetical protein QRY02_16090 [Amycolatopsis sp. DG1A-15b]
MHLDHLAAAVQRDRRVVADVAPVLGAGAAVAGQQRQHAPAQRVDVRLRCRVVLRPQQPRAEHRFQLLVQGGQVARGERRVVGQVVLEVEHDDDRGGGRVLRGPRVHHGQPVAEVVRRRVAAAVVHEVAGGVVADGVVVRRRVAVVVHIEFQEPHAVVELVGEGVLGAVDVSRIAVVGRAEHRRGERRARGVGRPAGQQCGGGEHGGGECGQTAHPRVLTSGTSAPLILAAGWWRCLEFGVNGRR